MAALQFGPPWNQKRYRCPDRTSLTSGPRRLTSDQPSYSSSLTFAIQSTALPSSAS